MGSLRVMVTDASYKHAVGIVRSLGRAGHHVTCVSHHALAPGRFSRYCKQFILVPDPAAHPCRYSEQVGNYCAQHTIDLLIPVGFSSHAALINYGTECLPGHCAALLPRRDQFALASDKWEMTEYVRQLGIAVPDSALLRDHEAVKNLQSLYGRLVVKPRSEYQPKHIWRITSGELSTVTNEASWERLIVQQYVPGRGAGYLAIAIRGKVIREYTHERSREWPPEGGVATAACTTDNQELKSFGRRILSALSWTGAVMVEFRVSEHGVYFIELNPKFWGSLELGLESGADFPGDLCRWAMGEDLTQRPLPYYTVGQRYWWPLRGDIRRLFRCPGDLVPVLKDLISPRSCSNLSWRDPLPNLIELGAECLYPLRRHE